MKKILLSTFSALLLASAVSAQAPQFINYQAAVRNASGMPLATSIVQVRFTIHDVSATGATLYQETNSVSTTAQGILNTTIGSGTPVTGIMAAIDWAMGTKFLEVELNTGSGYISIGTQQMVSVPYSLYSANATKAMMADSSSKAHFSDSSAIAHYADSTGKAHYSDTASKSAFADSAAKAGNVSWTKSGTDIYNNNTGRVGIDTTTPSPQYKMHINGTGGTAAGSPYYHGTLMLTGAGIAADYTGLYAEGSWKGIVGRNRGTSSRTRAIGVYGLTDSSTNYSLGYGVYGEATASGLTNYGVYGTASNGTSANYAGYFAGNVQVTGSISKGSGTFKIDHPLDPENKYLYHSFVESPDMMNIYNGNIVTNGKGFATVEMPSYFDALNKDFRYQLTVLGTFAQAIIKDKIAGNKFVIQTNEPNVEVSWMVTGVRHDKYADAHRVVAEVDKEAQYKGLYLHPAEWNQPESKGIDNLTRNNSTTNNVPATNNK